MLWKKANFSIPEKKKERWICYQRETIKIHVLNWVIAHLFYFWYHDVIFKICYIFFSMLTLYEKKNCHLYLIKQIFNNHDHSKLKNWKFNLIFFWLKNKGVTLTSCNDKKFSTQIRTEIDEICLKKKCNLRKHQLWNCK